jgi:hypothetical protein
MNTRQLTALVLLVAAIGLMQYHAIMFWSEHVDLTTGWAWSLLLEGSALWLWSSKRIAQRILGAVATVLVLAGPLYQVSAPLITEWQATDRGAVANAERRTTLTAEINSLETALNTYLSNSATRQGWASRLDATQARLDTARNELKAVIAAEAMPTRLTWQRQAVIAMQAIALVLFQILGVLAIRTLATALQMNDERDTKAAQHRPQQAARPTRLARAA